MPDPYMPDPYESYHGVGPVHDDPTAGPLFFFQPRTYVKAP